MLYADEVSQTTFADAHVQHAHYKGASARQHLTLGHGDPSGSLECLSTRTNPHTQTSSCAAGSERNTAPTTMFFRPPVKLLLLRSCESQEINTFGRSPEMHQLECHTPLPGPHRSLQKQRMRGDTTRTKPSNGSPACNMEQRKIGFLFNSSCFLAIVLKRTQCS